MFWIVATVALLVISVVLLGLYWESSTLLDKERQTSRQWNSNWREACEQRRRLQDAYDIAEAKAEDRLSRLTDAMDEVERLKYDKEQLSKHSAKLSEEVSNLRKEVERLQQRRPSNKELDEYRKEARGCIARQIGIPLAGLVRIVAGNQWIIEGSKELRDAIESVSETACRINDEEEFT